MQNLGYIESKTGLRCSMHLNWSMSPLIYRMITIWSLDWEVWLVEQLYSSLNHHHLGLFGIWSLGALQETGSSGAFGQKCWQKWARWSGYECSQDLKWVIHARTRPMDEWLVGQRGPWKKNMNFSLNISQVLLCFGFKIGWTHNCVNHNHKATRTIQTMQWLKLRGWVSLEIFEAFWGQAVQVLWHVTSNCKKLTIA